tara:strand:+ start:1460 stop:1912 length:453 start_codon:yes stop_codon:yes gene_type:complete
MPDKKEKKTKIGKFLQSINFSKAADVVGNLISGNIKGALDVIVDKDNGMSPEERDFALTVMKLDIQEMESVSERWKADMRSDSYLSKNVRPLSLIFLTVTTVILIYLDFYHGEELDVPGEWIELLKSLLLGIYIAYFGSRGIEKYKSIGQ